MLAKSLADFQKQKVEKATQRSTVVKMLTDIGQDLVVDEHRCNYYRANKAYSSRSHFLSVSKPQ